MSQLGVPPDRPEPRCSIFGKHNSILQLKWRVGYTRDGVSGDSYQTIGNARVTQGWIGMGGSSAAVGAQARETHGSSSDQVGHAS